MNDKPDKINLSDINSRKIDENMLAELRDLFERAEDQKERYDFTWNGKAKAYFEAATPTTKTLRPQPEKSVDFENSENLFITGDNLEALKLLQESYLGKVDMIYIDPPYNTGKDFIYYDNFQKTQKDTDISEGNVDEEGNRLVKNDKSNGRYHSDWLTMMYPRLKLARNLLSDTGAIFVSIDDNEQANLKLLMDEIFGENNEIETLIWKRRATPPNDRSIGKNHEYILVFAKNYELVNLGLLPRNKESIARYSNPDNDPKGPWVASDLSANGKGGRLSSSTIYGIVNPKNGVTYYPSENKSWLYSQEKMHRYINEGKVAFREKTGSPFLKRYLSEVRNGVTMPTILTEFGNSQTSAKEVDSLFEKKGLFEFPKPVKLLEPLITIGAPNQNAIILDFFAGSSTTAHAVMQLNKRDHTKKKYIMIQLPEKIKSSKEAYKSGFTSIDQLSRERLRRAAKKIGDTSGFRALKVANTGLRQDIFKTADELGQSDLLADIDNQSDKRGDYDLLYDVLVNGALEYNREIVIDVIDGEKIIKYDYLGELSGVIAYFGDNLTDELTRKIAILRPLLAVFKESTFEKSAQKVNVLEQFRIISPETKVKVI